MDKDTKQEFEKRDKILDGMREEIDSLTGSLSDFKNETTGKMEDLIQSQSSLRDSKDTSKEGSEDLASLHEEALEENARLTEKTGKLEERNAFLESPGYQQQVIQGFLRELDADNFLSIGIKLGYLEDTEAGPEDLEGVEGAEVPLGDGQVLKVSKEKPEDMTGWEFSETQGLYIKLG